MIIANCCLETFMKNIFMKWNGYLEVQLCILVTVAVAVMATKCELNVCSCCSFFYTDILKSRIFPIWAPDLIKSGWIRPILHLQIPNPLLPFPNSAFQPLTHHHGSRIWSFHPISYIFQVIFPIWVLNSRIRRIPLGVCSLSVLSLDLEYTIINK